MIQVIAPCCIPFKGGTTIYGSTANTVLPDPMLGSVQFGNANVIINKTIGDDLLLPSNPPVSLCKVYDLLGTTLFEYTLFQVAVPGMSEPYFVPISVKRYDMTMPYTFFFTNGVTLALDTIRGTRDYSIISATALLKMFSGNPISFVDTMFSVQLPSTMENILSELGSYAFCDPECSDIALRTLFEELSKSYDSLMAYDRPTDTISYYGCQHDNIIPKSLLMHSIDISSHSFYSQFENECHTKLQERANAGLLYPLDINVQEYHSFQIPCILNELYQAPYTDISMIVEPQGPRNIYTQKLFGMRIGDQPTWSHLTVEASVATYLHDGLVHYNQLHPNNQIYTIVFSKNWLDDVHFDVYYTNNNIRNFYLNMSLYHLYSPSIVRMYRQSM